jgi:hypothetical protein
VPWCPTCDRFLSPPTVNPDGTCPKCGRPVEPGRAGAAEPGPDRRSRPSTGPDGDRAPAAEEELPPVPRHLKFLGAAMVVYLGYRFLQGVEWVVHRF